MFYALGIIAALLFAFFTLIYIIPGPRGQQSDKSAWLRTVPIAHRGLHGDKIPENSLAAFAAAVEAGYAIEMDLQLSADGKVVVFHDYGLARMTGFKQKVRETSWEQLRQLKLAGSEQGIPLFSELLALVAGKVPLLIEVKNEGAVGALEQAVIDQLKGYQGDCALQSFNPFVVQYFAKHAPEMTRGQLSSNFKGEKLALWKKFLLRNLLLNFISKPAFIAYEYGALPDWFARRVREKGLLLLTWTVRNEEDYKRARLLFDNIIFEGFLAPPA